MFSPRGHHLARRTIASLAVAGVMSTGAVAALSVVAAAPAGAQTASPAAINPNDFIDPNTGEFDLEAYLAAVAAENAQKDDGTGAEAVTTGNLPYTGSNTQDLAVAGVAVLVTGGAAALIANRRRTAAAKAPTSVG